MTKARDFFRAFTLCRSNGKTHGIAGAKNAQAMPTKKLPNYRFFFFAKIAFQLSL